MNRTGIKIDATEVFFSQDLGETASRFSYNVLSHTDGMSIRCVGYVGSSTNPKELQAAQTTNNNQYAEQVVDVRGYNRVAIGITGPGTVDINTAVSRSDLS